MITIRHLIEAQRKLVPSPSQVVEAEVSSATIRERLSDPFFGSSLPPGDATLQRIRRLLGHEPFLYHVVRQPKADVEEWTARVPAMLRAYRDIASIDDYLDCLIRRVAPPSPPSVPPSPSPLDIPYAIGYLDAVWKSKTGSRLFVNLDAASVARLTLSCGDEEDFNSLMSALADVLGQMVRPGTSTPLRGSALEAVRDHLIPQLGGRCRRAHHRCIRDAHPAPPHSGQHTRATRPSPPSARSACRSRL
jgi:hypothetical protein